MTFKTQKSLSPYVWDHSDGLTRRTITSLVSGDTLGPKEVPKDKHRCTISSRISFSSATTSNFMFREVHFLSQRWPFWWISFENQHKLPPACVCVNKQCFVMVPTMIYTLLNSRGFGKHPTKLSDANLMLLTGGNEVWSRHITFGNHSKPLFLLHFLF